jgi:hypothetical protein
MEDKKKRIRALKAAIVALEKQRQSYAFNANLYRKMNVVTERTTKDNAMYGYCNEQIIVLAEMLKELQDS